MTSHSLKPEVIIQTGHTAWIWSVAVSKDGKYLASGSSDDKVIKLWEIATGRLIRNLIGHGGWVLSIDFSPDGKHLLSTGHDGTRYWNLETGEHETLAFGSGSILRFISNTEVIFAGGGDHHGYITLFDITQKNKIANFTGGGHSKEVTTLAVSRSANLLVSGSKDGTAILWDLEKRAFIRQYEVAHEHFVSSVAIDQAEQPSFFITGLLTPNNRADPMAKLKVWPIGADGSASSEEPYELSDREGSAYAMDISEDGQFLATAFQDRTIGIWSLTGDQPHFLYSLQGDATRSYFSLRLFTGGNGTILATGGEDGRAKYWEIAAAAEEVKQEAVQVFDGQSSVVFTAVLHNHPYCVIEGSQNDEINLWDLEKGQLAASLNKGVTYDPPSAAWSSIQALDTHTILKLLASGSGEGRLCLWDLETRALKYSHKFSHGIRSVQFTEDGSHLAISTVDQGSKTGRTYLLDIGTEIILLADEGFIEFDCHAAIHSAQGYLAVAYDHYRNTGDYRQQNNSEPIPDLVLVDLKTREKKVLDYHGDRIRGIRMSKNGRYLVSASHDRHIRIWDLEDLSAPQVFLIDESNNWLVSVDISGDGQRIIVGSRDNNAYLFDVQAKKVVQSFQGHDAEVFVRFSEDEKYIITCSRDSTTRIWKPDTGEEIAMLVSIGEEDWAVLTPSGLFDASQGAMTKMHFVQGLETIALEQLKKRYYEPGLLAMLMSEREDELRAVEEFDSAPLYPLVRKAEVKEGVLHIELEERAGGLGKVWVKVNSKEIIEDANPARKSSLTVQLDPFKQHFRPATWDNQISIITFNQDGWLRSKPHVIEEYWPTFVSGKAGKRAKKRQKEKESSRDLQLFATFIGTSKYQLKDLVLDYPDLDATRLAETMELAGKKLFKNIYIRQFVSDKPIQGQELATKENIKKAFQEFGKKAKEKDVLLLFLSGHGDTHGTGEEAEYYYLMKDLPQKDLRSKEARNKGAISTGELTEWIKEIAARKQVMILDTCNSGGFIKGIGKKKSLGSTQQRTLDEMKDRTGMWVLAGSADSKESYENYALGQGILTYSLLKGIKGGALRSDDETPIIDVQQLLGFAMREVPKLAKRAGREQEPVLSIPQEGGATFSLGLADEDIRKLIKLPDPKPIFIRSVFLDSATYCDTIDLSTALDRLYKLEQSKWLNKTGEAAIVFVDVSRFPDAHYVSGIYSKKKNGYEVVAYIFNNKKPIHKTAIKAEGANAQALAEALEKEIKTKIKDIKKK